MAEEQSELNLSLCKAAVKGDLEKLRAHLGWKPFSYLSSVKNNKGQPLLHLAAYYGQINIISYLLSGGIGGWGAVDVNTLDSQGYTALCYAANAGQFAACMYLLKHGAKTESITDKLDECIKYIKPNNVQPVQLTNCMEEFDSLRREHKVLFCSMIISFVRERKINVDEKFYLDREQTRQLLVLVKKNCHIGPIVGVPHIVGSLILKILCYRIEDTEDFKTLINLYKQEINLALYKRLHGFMSINEAHVHNIGLLLDCGIGIKTVLNSIEKENDPILYLLLNKKEKEIEFRKIIYYVCFGARMSAKVCSYWEKIINKLGSYSILINNILNEDEVLERMMTLDKSELLPFSELLLLTFLFGKSREEIDRLNKDGLLKLVLNIAKHYHDDSLKIMKKIQEKLNFKEVNPLAVSDFIRLILLDKNLSPKRYSYGMLYFVEKSIEVQGNIHAVGELGIIDNRTVDKFFNEVWVREMPYLVGFFINRYPALKAKTFAEDRNLLQQAVFLNKTKLIPTLVKAGFDVFEGEHSPFAISVATTKFDTLEALVRNIDIFMLPDNLKATLFNIFLIVPHTHTLCRYLLSAYDLYYSATTKIIRKNVIEAVVKLDDDILVLRHLTLERSPKYKPAHWFNKAWCANGVKVVNMLLTKYPELKDIKFKNGYDLLQQAIFEEKLSFIDMLIDQGFEIFTGKITAFHLACQKDNVSIFSRLVARLFPVEDLSLIPSQYIEAVKNSFMAVCKKQNDIAVNFFLASKTITLILGSEGYINLIFLKNQQGVYENNNIFFSETAIQGMSSLGVKAIPKYKYIQNINDFERYMSFYKRCEENLLKKIKLIDENYESYKNEYFICVNEIKKIYFIALSVGESWCNKCFENDDHLVFLDEQVRSLFLFRLQVGYKNNNLNKELLGYLVQNEEVYGKLSINLSSQVFAILVAKMKNYKILENKNNKLPESIYKILFVEYLMPSIIGCDYCKKHIFSLQELCASTIAKNEKLYELDESTRNHAVSLKRITDGLEMAKLKYEDGAGISIFPFQFFTAVNKQRQHVEKILHENSEYLVQENSRLKQENEAFRKQVEELKKKIM